MLMLAASPVAAAEQPTSHGPTISASYVSDVLADVAGGRRRGVSLLGKADVMASLPDDAFGIPGARAFVDLQYVHGRSFSTHRVGDAQVVSNIDAVSALRPFEAWLQVPLRVAGAPATATAGLLDLNGIFDIQDVGRLFLNSSHGIGPDFSQTGRNGPSIFPTTTLAAALAIDANPTSLRFGVFEGVAGDPDRPRRTVLRVPGDGGLLLIAEADRTIGDAQVQVGAWSYAARFETLAPPAARTRQRGNHGGYAQIEGRLAGTKGARELQGWLRVGVARARFNPIGRYLGGGLSWGDDSGRFGIAFAHARLGGPGRAELRAAGSRPHRAETNVEITYSRRVAPWLRVQPDVQYVVNPSWRRDISDALVVGMRFVATSLE